MARKLSCRELVEFLADYLSGQLEAARVAAFDLHLAGCPACLNYTRAYRLAVRLGQDALRCPDAEVPADVPEELVRAILAAREEST